MKKETVKNTIKELYAWNHHQQRKYEKTNNEHDLAIGSRHAGACNALGALYMSFFGTAEFQQFYEEILEKENMTK